MRFNWRLSAAIAVLVFASLFAVRFVTAGPGSGLPIFGVEINLESGGADSFEMSRRNYASAKKQAPSGGGAIPPAIFENQKYEKIGSITQVTSAFDDDRRRAFALIDTNGGIVQQERAIGQKGSRFLQLGIGVPPERFDAFIEEARSIGKGVSIDIVKNDKTNEYLQLRAKRQTLEKARTALEDLRAGGGSTNERVTVQNRLTEIEQQIQDLGVSLGEFDSQNELCTVKLSLREYAEPAPWSVGKRATQALQLAIADYMMVALGFFAIITGLWIAARFVVEARKMMQL